MSRRGRLAALVLALGLGACTAKEPPNAVVRIGDDFLEWEELEPALRDRSGSQQLETLSSVVLAQLLDQVLEEELLRRFAVERGWVAEGADRRAARRSIAEGVLASPQVDPAAARRYYDQHPEEFGRPERVHLRQILAVERDAAEEAAARLEAGEDFSVVAADLSTEPNADRGGDQGFLARRDLPRGMAEEVFALEVGAISPIVETPYGFHIFQVLARRPPETLPFELARSEIERRLEVDARETQIQRLVSEAETALDIEVLDHRLPFEYLGRFASSRQRGEAASAAPDLEEGAPKG